LTDGQTIIMEGLHLDVQFMKEMINKYGR